MASIDELSFTECANVLQGKKTDLGIKKTNLSIKKTNFKDALCGTISDDVAPVDISNTDTDITDVTDVAAAADIEEINIIEQSNREDGFTKPKHELKKEKRAEKLASTLNTNAPIYKVSNINDADTIVNEAALNKIQIVDGEKYMTPNSKGEYIYENESFRIVQDGKELKLIKTNLGSKFKFERYFCREKNCKRMNLLSHAFFHCIIKNGIRLVKMKDFEDVCLNGRCNGTITKCVLSKQHIYDNKTCKWHDPEHGNTCNNFMCESGERCCLFHESINAGFENFKTTYQISQMELPHRVAEQTLLQDSNELPQDGNELPQDDNGKNKVNTDKRHEIEIEIDEMNIKINETKSNKEMNKKYLAVAIKKVEKFKQELMAFENENNEIIEKCVEPVQDIKTKCEELLILDKAQDNKSQNAFINKQLDILSKLEEHIKEAKRNFSELKKFTSNETKMSEIIETKDKLLKKEDKINNIYNAAITKSTKEINDMEKRVTEMENIAEDMIEA